MGSSSQESPKRVSGWIKVHFTIVKNNQLRFHLKWNFDPFTYLLRTTVFSPKEAPGAKGVVWGASIFHAEAPNFEINMVKEDSETSSNFQAQNAQIEHQYKYRF